MSVDPEIEELFYRRIAAIRKDMELFRRLEMLKKTDHENAMDVKRKFFGKSTRVPTRDPMADFYAASELERRMPRAPTRKPDDTR